MQSIRLALFASLLLSAGCGAAQENPPPTPGAPRPVPDGGVIDVSSIEERPRITNWAEAQRVAEDAFGKALGPEGGRGSVTVRFLVNRDGRTSNATLVVPTGNSRLDEAALTAVRAMRFTPGMTLGKPVPVLMQVPLSYDAPPRRPRS